MWIRLLLLGLLCAAHPAVAQTPADFTLPGIADLEKQLAGGGDGGGDNGGQNDAAGQDNPEHRETLEKTLELRREIDTNRERIEALKK